MIRKLGLIGAIGALALAVAGCDDDESGPSAALSGTAAVGAPIVGGAITVNCAGTTTDITGITTDSLGNYSVPNSAMTDIGAVPPCAMKITLGPTVLFSLAQAKGRVNITPLTNLVVERAIVSSGAGASANAWFTAGADFTSVTDTVIDDAVGDIEDALMTATGETSVPFNVFTTKFKADSESTYDVWLDSFAQAITDAGTTYAALVSSFTSSGTLPNTITIEFDSGIGGGGGMGTMVIVTKVGTVTSPAVRIEGVPIPDTKAMFCTDAYYDVDALAEQGITNVTCSFSGSTGKITGKIQGISWVSTYTWEASAT